VRKKRNTFSDTELKKEDHRELAEEKKKRLRQSHYMRCPKCGMELTDIMLRKHIVAGLWALTLVL
jgi:hypothetical protein